MENKLLLINTSLNRSMKLSARTRILSFQKTRQTKKNVYSYTPSIKGEKYTG